ncbi:MAG: cytidine deaminase [Deltaproteobacteria bacterium]|nr:cytidine deaminase [Deltaproteobacteria bacterium]
MNAVSEENELIKKAIIARDNAYAPYSKFKVGAAVQLQDGRVFTGVNVENVSYGLTVCAERNAVAAAIQYGAKPKDIVSIAIAVDAPKPASPCGACRQVLAEFASEELVIILHNINSAITERMKLAELLPKAFSKDELGVTF